MAGVIGSSGGGYATVNPTQGNPMGEALQNVENSAFKYNAIKREEAQNEASQQKAIRDAKDKELKEHQSYADKHKISTTAISSVNKAVLDFSTDNKNLYNVAATTYKNSNNDEERRNALETMSNLESSFEIAKALPEMLNASAKDLEEGVRQGKYNPRSSTNAAETIEAMSKGDMKVVFTPNGIPTFITYKRDGQGNLTETIDREMTLEQLKQKISPIMNYSSEMNNEDFKKGLPKDAQEWEVGNNVYKGYKDIGVLAEQHANSIVTNRDKIYGIASDAGVTPKTNLADYTADEISKVKEHIKKGLEDKYKPSITTNDAKLNREQTAANQAENNRIARANLAQREKEANQSTETTTLTDATDVAGRIVKDKNTGETVKIAKVSTTKKVNTTANKATKSIPTYSVSDLKKNGWNDAQIKQAVKEGKIKTK